MQIILKIYLEPRTCFPLYRFHRFAPKKDAAAKRGTSFDDSNKNDKIDESIRAMRLGFENKIFRE